MRRARVERRRGELRQLPGQRAQTAAAAIPFFTGGEEGVPVETLAAFSLDQADRREELLLRARRAQAEAVGEEGRRLGKKRPGNGEQRGKAPASVPVRSSRARAEPQKRSQRT